MTPDIDAFLDDLGTSNQTCNGYRADLAHVFRMVQGAGNRIQQIPLRTPRSSRLFRSAPGILTPEDAATLLSACDPSSCPAWLSGCSVD